MQARWKQTGLSSAFSLLCMTGGWFIAGAIVPVPVHAYVSRVDVVVDVQPGEAYETFVARAEGIARAATQRTFDRDILISEAYVLVVGRKPEATVQVLSIQVSRNQWRSRPDARRWATYYSSAKIFLGFGRQSPATSATPVAPPTPTPTVIQPPPIAQPTVSAPAVPIVPPPPAPPQTVDPTSPTQPLPAPSPTRSPTPAIPPLRLQPGSTPPPPSR